MKESKGLAFISNGDGTCYVGDLGNCTDTDIVIPQTSPAGDRVTSVGAAAFRCCYRLTSMAIPVTVTSIGGFAFEDCDSLTSITFAENSKLTSIGDWAFNGCSALTSIEIPASVTSIGWAAFTVCNVTVLSVEGEAYKAFRVSKKGKLFSDVNHRYYELNKKSSCKGTLWCCSNGIHCCKNPFDIFTYYSGEYGKDFVIANCDISSEYVSHEEDSKIACRWIIPKHILTKEELIQTLNKQEG